MNSLMLIWRLSEKDLRIEFRSRQAFVTTVFFALLILVIFIFAFDPGSAASREAAPGILWVALLFPGVLQINRSIQLEMEEGTLTGLILSPVDRGVLYLGKVLSNSCFLVVLDLMILVVFIIFYNFTFSTSTLWLGLLILLVAIGFSAVGSVFGAMVSSIRTREVLLPILLLPIMLPIIIAAVNATQEVLLRQETDFLGRWIQLLMASDVIFVAVGFVLFEYVVAD